MVDLQLKSFTKKVLTRDIQIEFAPNVNNFLTDKSYIPEFGARPVKRAVDEYVINALSLQLLSGAVDKAKPIVVTSDETSLIFANKEVTLS